MLAKITALVVAHLALLEYIGWAPAAALLFGGVAWSLGAKLASTVQSASTGWVT